MKKPIIIKCPLMRKGYCLNLFGTYWARDTSWIDRYVINHERIHDAQQKELLYIPFYILYVLEWLFRLLQYRNAQKAYRNISFEREAYKHGNDLTYLARRKRGAWWKFLTFLVFIPLMSACISDSEEPEWALAPGDELPRFSVTTTTGETVTSDNSNLRPLVIIFFNTSCADCRRELPLLQKEYEENLRKPETERSQYICISREEDEASVVRYWEDNSLSLPVSPQRDRRIYSLFASVGIPRIFIASKNRIVSSSFPESH